MSVTTVIIVMIGVSAIALFAEACLIIPEKMPWNRRKDKK